MPINISNPDQEVFGVGDTTVQVTYLRATRVSDNQHIITAPLVNPLTINANDAVIFNRGEIDFDFGEGPYDINALDVMIKGLFGATYNEEVRIELMSSSTQVITGTYARKNLDGWAATRS